MIYAAHLFVLITAPPWFQCELLIANFRLRIVLTLHHHQLLMHLSCGQRQAIANRLASVE